MWGIIGFLAGIATVLSIPSYYKGWPILSVVTVYCRRTKGLKWLAWQLPFLGDNSWYFDIVEQDVFRSA